MKLHFLFASIVENFINMRCIFKPIKNFLIHNFSLVRDFNYIVIPLVLWISMENLVLHEWINWIFFDIFRARISKMNIMTQENASVVRFLKSNFVRFQTLQKLDKLQTKQKMLQKCWKNAEKMLKKCRKNARIPGFHQEALAPQNLEISTKYFLIISFITWSEPQPILLIFYIWNS